MSRRLMPQAMKYGNIQNIFFVCGMMLAIGALDETGFTARVSHWLAPYVQSVWTAGVVTGAISTVLDSYATSLAAFSVDAIPNLQSCYVENGSYWKVVVFASVVGGNILAIGSTSGLALLKLERMSIGWYFANIGWKALIAGVIGFASLWLFV